jgi:hypothetical protein
MYACSQTMSLGASVCCNRGIGRIKVSQNPLTIRSIPVRVPAGRAGSSNLIREKPRCAQLESVFLVLAREENRPMTRVILFWILVSSIAAEPQHSGTIQGRVVDEKGNPVQDAQVSVQSVDCADPKLWRVETSQVRIFL